MSEQPTGQNNSAHLEHHPNAVQDVDKAFDIAISAHEERSRAAGNRVAAKAIEGIADRKAEITDALYDSAEELNAAKDAVEAGRDDIFPRNGRILEDDPRLVRQDKAHEDHYHDRMSQLDLPSVPYIDLGAHVGNDMLKAVEKAGGDRARAEELFGHSQRRESKKRREYAEQYDEKAERIERWTEILADNPPSEAFKEKYAHKSINAQELIRIEHYIEYDKKRKEIESKHLTKILELVDSVFKAQYLDLSKVRDEDDVYGYSAFDRLDKSRDFTLVPDEAIIMAYGEKSDEYAGWQSMIANPDSTMGQLHKQYTAAVWELANSVLDRWKINEAFLDDIRSGRAAQWQ